MSKPIVCRGCSRTIRWPSWFMDRRWFLIGIENEPGVQPFHRRCIAAFDRGYMRALETIDQRRVRATCSHEAATVQGDGKTFCNRCGTLIWGMPGDETTDPAGTNRGRSSRAPADHGAQPSRLEAAPPAVPRALGSPKDSEP